jgi:hypothetical protein
MVTDVHTEHCCVVHGCKYNDPHCSVVGYNIPQSFLCEYCEDAIEAQIIISKDYQDMLAILPPDLLEKMK